MLKVFTYKVSVYIFIYLKCSNKVSITLLVETEKKSLRFNNIVLVAMKNMVEFSTVFEIKMYRVWRGRGREII